MDTIFYDFQDGYGLKSWTFNMSPEKGPFQKETRLPTSIFQGIC